MYIYAMKDNVKNCFGLLLTASADNQAVSYYTNFYKKLSGNDDEESSKILTDLNQDLYCLCEVNLSNGVVVPINRLITHFDYDSVCAVNMIKDGDINV